MSKMMTGITAVLALFLLSGCFALAEPEAASGTAVAPTLAAVVVEEAAADEPDPDAPVTPTVTREEPAAQEPGAAQEAAAASTGARRYVIDPARSEARFVINEVLRGTPTTVVGVTSNLAGELALDLANPATAQVGEIVVNARDLRTDNDFRNNAIANEILLTNAHEFITFTPTAVSGLPATAEIGQSYDFEISGDLTITGATRPVTFAASVTPLSADELQGSAAVTIAYADFGLTIPFSRSVESVEDTVVLALDFTAVGQ